MEKVITMNINLDEFMKELAGMDITKMDDQSLCALGLKLRLIVVSMNEQKNLTELQQQTVSIFQEYDELVGEEMLDRGYQVMDSDDLMEAEPDEIAESLVSLSTEGLLEWVGGLEKSTDEKDQRMVRFINNELLRRFQNIGGGLAEGGLLN